MAVISVSQTDNIQQKINTANAGDTVDFGSSSTFSIAGQLTLKNGVTYKGSGSLLNLTTGSNQFAVVLPNPASNITIDGLKFKANCGVILASGNASKITITNNDFVWGYNGTYYNRLAIRTGGVTDSMIVEHNYFHDSLTSDRTADLFNMQNSSYSYNKFYKVNDGGHLDGETLNFKFVGNTLTQIHRMGLELQNNWGAVGGNILISDNVMTDWYQPNGLSFGLSIMPQLTSGVTIQNNYISLGNEPVTADSGHGNYAGYGIESGLTTGIVQGNTIIGAWCMAITCSMANTPLKNNKAYGTQVWGPFGGEPGAKGTGSVLDQGGNQGNLPIAQAPPPPNSGTSSSSSGGTSSSSSGGNPPASMSVSGVTDHDCVVAFANVPANASLQIKFASKDNSVALGTVTLPTNTTTATITNLPNGWEIAATGIVNGSSLTAVQFKTTGGPGPWPWTGGYATLKTPPPPDITKTYTTPLVSNYILKTIDYPKNSDGSPKLNEDGTATISLKYNGL